MSPRSESCIDSFACSCGSLACDGSHFPDIGFYNLVDGPGLLFHGTIDNFSWELIIENFFIRLKKMINSVINIFWLVLLGVVYFKDVSIGVRVVHNNNNEIMRWKNKWIIIVICYTILNKNEKLRLMDGNGKDKLNV